MVCTHQKWSVAGSPAGASFTRDQMADMIRIQPACGKQVGRSEKILALLEHRRFVYEDSVHPQFGQRLCSGKVALGELVPALFQESLEKFAIRAMLKRIHNQLPDFSAQKTPSLCHVSNRWYVNKKILVCAFTTGRHTGRLLLSGEWNNSTVMVRTFIALELSGEIRDTLKEAQQVLRGCSARLTFVDPALIHITVKFLGEVDGKKLVQVQDVLKTLSFTPFPVTAGMVTVNNPKRPHTVWCTIDDGGNGQQLLGLIEAGLSPLGFAREDRRFTPHATVARVKSPDPSLFSALDQLRQPDLWQLHDQRHETQEEHPDPPGAGVRGPARGEMVKRLPLRGNSAGLTQAHAGREGPCVRYCRACA